VTTGRVGEAMGEAADPERLAAAILTAGRRAIKRRRAGASPCFRLKATGYRLQALQEH
jgi:hypothetical protein